MMKHVMTALAALCLAGAAQAEPDIKKGKTVFKKCKACHTVKEGKNRSGPSLYGIVDAQAGSVEGFNYSKAMAESGLVWDAETLAGFLADPKATVPGNKMSFPGLRKEADIANVIAYILDESS